MPVTKMINSCAPLYSPKAKEELVTSVMYNVIDEYKPLSQQEIIDKVAENTLDYAVCIQNFSGEFSQSSLIRSANALGAKEIFYFGIKRFDRRGSVGSHIYSKVTWLETEDDIMALKTRFNLVAVDKISKSVPVQEFDFSRKNNLFIFGSEGSGLLPSVIDMCDSAVHINQRGSIRSINVASAATVIMTFAEIALGKDQPVK